MATLYKRGQTYWLKWYVGGKPHYESTKTRDKKTASILRSAKEIELRTGTNPVPKGVPTFTEFADVYLNWRASEHPDSHERVDQIIRDHLKPTFGTLTLDKIDPLTVEQWKQNRRRKVTHRKRPTTTETVNKELRTLRAVLNKAVEWEVIARSPIKSVRELRGSDSKPKNFYSADALEAIYTRDPDNAAIWRLLANTGMRRAEAVNLTWGNVLDQHIRVVSVEGRRTKNREWRDIPISPGCRLALDILRRDATTDYVLPRIHEDSLTRAFKKVLKRTGNTGNLHDLRHTFISHLVMQGVPLRTVQVLAGHKNIAVTEGYAHMAPNHMLDAVAGLRL